VEVGEDRADRGIGGIGRADVVAARTLTFSRVNTGSIPTFDVMVSRRWGEVGPR